MTYASPVAELRFALEAVAEIGRLRHLPGGDAVDGETLEQVLSEAAKLADEVIAPLNAIGDRVGSKLENGVVRTPPGWQDAYRRFVDGGWNTLPFTPDFGGQGLPWALAIATQEIWQGANLAFGLCPLLTQGAIELLSTHGSPAQKARYLPQMIAGRWTGTMNLTEPQAGSDLGALRTRAEPADGGYRISGQKIFITYGDHDLAANVVHLVLARLPDAPAGSQGISLFIVPKFRVNADGNLGERNDLRPVSLEHKLGIHASPTCVMAYGDAGGAWGELVGMPHRGLECMFTMMNHARLTVGLQGVAIAERAFQQARDFARSRIQGRELGASSPQPVPIIRHPDVRRMLMAMRTGTEAARGLAYRVAVALDLAGRHPDRDERARHQALVDLLIPVVKAWSTDLGVEIASLGVQVHGGMGFIEETGAAQHYRDARILPIYEGTNGIQSNDLVFRKLARDRGAAMNAFLAECTAVAADLADSQHPDARELGVGLAAATRALAAASTRLIALVASDARAAAAGAATFLRATGLVGGGLALALGCRVVLARQHENADGIAFSRAKLAGARFYAEHWLATVPALAHTAASGSAGTLALADDAI